MNKPVYLAVSILELSKIVMCESWFDYERLKYREKAKLCYMDTDDFIVLLKLIIFIKTLQKKLKQGLIFEQTITVRKK